MKKLITLFLAAISFCSYAQEMVQYNGRMFTKSQPMSVEPAWSSKFVTGDLLLCTYDSIIYQCNANIVVGLDDTIEIDEYDPNSLKKAEIVRIVKDYSSDMLRKLVDEKRLFCLWIRI